jgi:hypothetical protein
MISAIISARSTNNFAARRNSAKFRNAGFGGESCSGSWAHLGPPVSANLIWYPGLVSLKAALFGVWLSRVLGRQSTTI